MKPWKHAILVALALITILSLVLSACELIDNGNGGSDDSNGRGKDKNKGDDKENGKDKAGKITICHKTGSAKNPYTEITVSNDATMDGHSTHEGDIIPAPEGGCPTE
jgi:hypothetical protein